MRPFTEFHAPETVEEAVSILNEKGSAARVIAGGTDLMFRLRRGMVPSSCTTMVSVHRVAEMRGCRTERDELVLGAATTAADLIRDAVIRKHAPILGQVADRLASAQIRNVATVGGNLVNASPAGDLISPLLLLDARVVLASPAGRREVPVERFFTGPGETVMHPGELLVEVRCALPAPERVFRFEKAGTRPAMECSVVTVGIAYTPVDGRLTEVRATFGSSAPVPLRGRATEAALEGRTLSPETVRRAVEAAEQEVEPISDVRGSDCYRRALVGIFVRRLLDD